MSDGTPKQSGPRIDGYASALLEVAKAEGKVDRVADELFRFARAIEQNDQLRDSLTNATLPVELRQGIVEELLGARARRVGGAEGDRRGAIGDPVERRPAGAACQGPVPGP